jgi:hypothetical protein
MTDGAAMSAAELKEFRAWLVSQLGEAHKAYDAADLKSTEEAVRVGRMEAFYSVLAEFDRRGFARGGE